MLSAKTIRRIPATILTGFLGAGKTTLLQRLLTEDHGRRVVVIENEFANLDIDASLVKSKTEDTVELKNGCVCCSIKDELIASLIALAAREQKFDELVIETTGVANPSSLVQAFLADPLVRTFYELNAVVTVVDGKHFEQHDGESGDFSDQIAFADLLLLNKIDLMEPELIDRVEARVREINPATELVRTAHCQVPWSRVFGRHDYDLTKIRPGRIAQGKGADLPALVSSISLDVTGEIDEERFMKWLTPFITELHHNLYRTKGIFHFAGHEFHVVVQGVHAIFSAAPAEAGTLERGKSRVVFIGKALPKDRIVEGIRGAIASPLQFSFTPVTPASAGATSPAAAPSLDWRVRIV